MYKSISAWGLFLSTFSEIRTIFPSFVVTNWIFSSLTESLVKSVTSLQSNCPKLLIIPLVPFTSLLFSSPSIQETNTPGAELEFCGELLTSVVILISLELTLLAMGTASTQR